MGLRSHLIFPASGEEYVCHLPKPPDVVMVAYQTSPWVGRYGSQADCTSPLPGIAVSGHCFSADTECHSLLEQLKSTVA